MRTALTTICFLFLLCVVLLGFSIDRLIDAHAQPRPDYIDMTPEDPPVEYVVGSETLRWPSRPSGSFHQWTAEVKELHIVDDDGDVRFAILQIDGEVYLTFIEKGKSVEQARLDVVSGNVTVR